MPAPLQAIDHDVHRAVRRIPRGKVVTYGMLAELIGLPGRARRVAAAMRKKPEGAAIPWHRVVGKRRRGVAHVAIQDPYGAQIQRGKLEAEGIVFDDKGGISLRAFGFVVR